MTDLGGLNPEQLDAVTHGSGPLLILAGAGTGKTRVVTHRIAHLVQTGAARGHEILAVTFTNKAAREIRERAAALAGDRAARATLSTFHSACARWLRRHGRAIGLGADFSIYDSDDQTSLLKQVLDELGHPTDASSLRFFRSHIESARHRAATPTQVHTEAIGSEAERAADVFETYSRALTRANATDFGGLISSMVHLLESDDHLRAAFRAQYRHVMVDEFQDTNVAQYRLLRALAPADGDVAVVGDDDQSIYGWRGASVENVRRFRDDYGCRVIALERNYRSTATILAAAHAIVSRLPERMDKQLRHTREEDERVRLYVGHDDREEAAWVARNIAKLRVERGLRYSDFAIFYRTNAQSRAFEDRLRREGLPYDVVGGVSFFERREVKDLLAYVRLAANPADDVALRRIINVPTRGVGGTSERRLRALVREGAVPSMREAVRLAASGALPRIARKTRDGLERLSLLLDELEALARDGAVAELIETAIVQTDYRAWLASDEDTVDERERNLDALIDAARDVAREQPDAGVVGFLEYAALRQATDAITDDDSRVQMMTVHMSKGLEFPVVFVTGLEDGQFPMRRANAVDDEGRDDEERRLCYVAWTRARDLLMLSAADQRMVHGTTRRSPISTFLTELPDELVRVERASSGGTRTPKPADRHRAAPSWDEFDQRPVHEREPVTGVPPSGIVFDDTWFPEESVTGARAFVGRRAVHKLFGTGRIVAADPSGERVRLTIDFPRAGIKKVVASYVEVID